MREAIGGTSLFGIVIVFILLFSGYLALSLNSSKAYKVKNEVVDIIQRENGMTDAAVSEIRDYLATAGYRTSGRCSEGRDDTGWMGLYNNELVNADNGGNYQMCVKREDLNTTHPVTGDQVLIPASYYKVKVFYHLDIPIISTAFNLTVKGDTYKLYVNSQAVRG